jgi:hypothetical protein
MTNFFKVQPGRKFQPSAGTWTAMIDAARSHVGPTVVRVRNDTQEDLGRFAIVGLDEMLIKPTDRLSSFMSQPTWAAKWKSVRGL